MDRISLPLTALKYSCGECSQCCIIPSFSEMGKDSYEPCRYINGKGYGCSIYSDRPETCVQYKCLWKEGQIEESDSVRPDKLGLMFTRSRNISIGFYFIIAWETYLNAYNTEEARRVVAKLSKTTLVLIRKYKSKDSIPIGPISLVEAFYLMYSDVRPKNDLDVKTQILRSVR